MNCGATTVAVVEDTLEDQMEGRLAKVESDVAHLRTEVADLKADHRQLRETVIALTKFVYDLRDEMHSSFVRLEAKIDKKSLQDRLWTGGLILTVLGVMAHGFKWL
jgi:hypothetical protein